MTLAVLYATNEQPQLDSGTAAILFTRDWNEWTSLNADAWINLQEDAIEKDYSFTQKPVFIHSVTNCLSAYQHGDQVVRINGWNGFPERPVWEYAGKGSEQHQSAMAAIHKQLIAVPDQPGFITARIISLIINEAYFALGERVSTEAAIDTAMKLGTNYPKGPFEWAALIGKEKIYHLLLKLTETDIRYTPALSLEKETVLS